MKPSVPAAVLAVLDSIIVVASWAGIRASTVMALWGLGHRRVLEAVAYAALAALMHASYPRSRNNKENDR